MRFTSTNISIWNRDAEHADGIQRILDTVMENLSPDLKPKENSCYYKKHFEHKDFSGHRPTASVTLDTAMEQSLGATEDTGTSKQTPAVEERMIPVIETPETIVEEKTEQIGGEN